MDPLTEPAGTHPGHRGTRTKLERATRASDLEACLSFGAFNPQVVGWTRRPVAKIAFTLDPQRDAGIVVVKSNATGSPVGLSGYIGIVLPSDLPLPDDFPGPRTASDSPERLCLRSATHRRCR